MLPIVRTFISLPAGVARMPFWRFSLYTFLGALPWVAALCGVGVAVGPHWKRWEDRLKFLDYLVAALIVAGRRLALPALAAHARVGRRRLTPRR